MDVHAATHRLVAGCEDGSLRFFSIGATGITYTASAQSTDGKVLAPRLPSLQTSPLPTALLVFIAWPTANGVQSEYSLWRGMPLAQPCFLRLPTEPSAVGSCLRSSMKKKRS